MLKYGIKPIILLTNFDENPEMISCAKREPAEVRLGADKNLPAWKLMFATLYYSFGKHKAYTDPDSGIDDEASRNVILGNDRD